MRSEFALLSALLVPPRCMVCASSCRSASPTCDRCRVELARAERGRPRRLDPSSLDSLSAAYEYEGVARAAVHALKFSGRVALAELMGEMLFERAPGTLNADCVIVPVPSHPANRRKRGFDQARLLADALSKATGAPIADCLMRHGLRGAQTEMGRAGRLAIPVGEFAIGPAAGRHCDADPLAEFPTNVVVCDDVATTTCTLEACASAIRERCKVQTIHGLTFASASALH